MACASRCVAYYLLAGSDVFDGQSVLEVCGQHLHQKPEPFSARGVAVPADLEALVLSCLEKDAARRPQSAAELRLELEAITVEPWDGESARLWWLEHEAALHRDTPANPSGPKTIAVDGARTPAAPAPA